LKSLESKPTLRKWTLILLLSLLSILLAVAAGWSYWVYTQIQIFAGWDQAAPADAIGVLGAAEYDGRPSPVYRARLDHALVLYHRGIAPLLITLGGPGGDQFNEGSVGETYLISKGVPEEDIIAETETSNTEESARRIAVLAHVNGLHRLVIVSDGTHLFRIHAICAAEGLDVLTSPRPNATVEDRTLEAERIAHEILSYTFWRLHLY
jgi:vancomycin permeability regulator SanA